MPHSQKAELGHRGRAFAELKPRLSALVKASGHPHA
jgi:inosine/xanthosine triphosphate pyrophosphatase family protein